MMIKTQLTLNASSLTVHPTITPARPAQKKLPVKSLLNVCIREYERKQIIRIQHIEA